MNWHGTGMMSLRPAFVLQFVVHIAARRPGNNAAARERMGVVGEADGT
jgi:hypothetical protein